VGSQLRLMMSTDWELTLVEMSERCVTDQPRRTKLKTVVLAAVLVGGALAIDTVGSHLSNEIGRGDRSTSVPAPAGPGAPLRTSNGPS
jgi:hypothetical protein